MIFSKGGMQLINQITEELGVYSDGCKCQSKIALMIGDGEVVRRRILGKQPCFETKPDDFCGRDRVQKKNNQLYYDDGDKLIPLTDWHKVENQDGEWIILEECNIWEESLYSYLNEMAESLKKDGMYILIVKIGCWRDYDYYSGGYDCDTDLKFKILESKH